ncbi:MAG: glycerophosphodiester phosphodiesterase [Elusimicrobia bacterium]|nr:glycerophosphodiester phosphodiesterase [Elusimicrobiota bacterium]
MNFDFKRFAVAFIAAVFLAPPARALEVIAHRGVHQSYQDNLIGRNPCAEMSIDKPEHPFIENTLASMAEAFRRGATMVELDVYRTSDDKIAVFHDDDLGCKTDGRGDTSAQTLQTLKTLDVGYGYRYDKGKTYPLRGSGVGMMPALEEVLTRFPGRKFMINQKDQSLQTVETLARILNGFPASQRAQLQYLGARKTYLALKKLVPDIGPELSEGAPIAACALAYFLTGAFGHFPAACRNKGLQIPLRDGEYLWGGFDQFVRKAHAFNSRVIVIGVNSAKDVESIKNIPVDGVMTDKIEVVGELYGNGTAAAF